MTESRTKRQIAVNEMILFALVLGVLQGGRATEDTQPMTALPTRSTPTSSNVPVTRQVTISNCPECNRLMHHALSMW